VRPETSSSDFINHFPYKHFRRAGNCIATCIAPFVARNRRFLAGVSLCVQAMNRFRANGLAGRTVPRGILLPTSPTHPTDSAVWATARKWVK